ncbi:subclass B3 metallo-beta-lactamase [Chryseobacterium gambrini]|uniref:Subclass B3 metallo-beta-lactamase n=1 Tax=Chryseobacterium gambrini TaxID=373672 RepID=A0AAJ1R8D6_9FLAO|nr:MULTISPECIES: subclass B3 metallo-beta-lactamase [Chryseobacterium]MDN4014124.1 subclass B3 metallo-beta-lactamase [Chryseobacterium gambrini]MDN4028179.1 subclass B3 metallo-beta-lactamase [Chryseobacterium gambrini]QWA39889.1 subclass B3 metallo-beta-lactamase [Chryseobacterium sp. ZHDP1]
MKKIVVIIAAFALTHINAQKVNEPKDHPEEWSQSYEPFRIAGNLYYIGTYDLASYLIVTSKGNILINTGLANSLPIIKNNIKKLGFKYQDTKILLLTQAHYDHLGAMTDIKKETGAKLYVDEADADVLKSGGKSDYELGKYGVTFKPVKPDYILKDKNVVTLGDAKLTMLHHPGHTKGSCSFLFETKDSKRSYKVLIANMPTIIVDKKFSEVTSYPSIEKDYEYTLNAMKNLDFDIWVASHASQFDLHEKHKPKDPYNPAVFMNKKEYQDELDSLEKDFLKKKSE